MSIELGHLPDLSLRMVVVEEEELVLGWMKVLPWVLMGYLIEVEGDSANVVECFVVDFAMPFV